ncbi:hypothetical protein GOP47_0015661 [Adiantum capillus-veneris]|uniref:glutathione transferase n=1 Tax=Adiantum capillus-veneris TaxID=13818 RepID=A0A9D4UK53_ADICA|nr:hypothetical protein GOP47_0015661 [Adiantum capillus-veneris]
MSPSDVKVLSAWYSLFGVRILIALKAKGVEYEFIDEPDLTGNKSKLLLESNPVHKKIPVLIHKGKPICESLIIVQYIDETWPSQHHKGCFLPQDPYERALVRFWADYVDKKVYEGCILILQNVKGALTKQGRSVVTESMVALDGALRDVFGPGPYFGGDQINLVDIALGSYLCVFETMETLGDFKVLDESTCPHLCAWAEAVAQYPSVKEGLATAPSHKVLEAIRSIRKTFFSLAE